MRLKRVFEWCLLAPIPCLVLWGIVEVWLKDWVMGVVVTWFFCFVGYFLYDVHSHQEEEKKEE